MSTNTLEITVQGRQYHVACKPEERESLLEAVALLDAKMGELAKKTRGSGERLAVMTALNLAHELLENRRQSSPGAAFDSQAFQRRIDSIEARLDAALSEQQNRLF